jgi:molybdopterin-binding protein
MLLAAILMASALAGAGAEIPPGTPIVAIRVVQTDIFDLSDPGTSAWPYRWANALHVLTRERFIRSLLLFRVGDKVDPALLAESERILRGTGFLSPVNISARPAPGGAEVVSIITMESMKNLGLTPGKDAYAVIKASSVMLAVDH